MILEKEKQGQIPNITFKEKKLN